MKRIFSILMVLFLFIPFGIKAQKKLDNTIVIDTTRTIKEIKQILFNNGFTVEGSDTLFFITTPKSMETAAVIRLMIARTDTSIIIKGQYKLQIEIFNVKPEYEMIEYRLSKQNLNKGWFEQMIAIAKSMGNKISYLKQ